VFQLPSLEYRNKTWSFYELMDAVKKEVIRAVWQNAKSFLKERLFNRKRETDTPMDASVPRKAVPAVDAAKRMLLFGQTQ
jgi:hypothetical protein